MKGKLITFYHYELYQLLGGIKESNLHEEISTGDVVGKEQC